MRRWTLALLLLVLSPASAGDVLHWVARGENAWRIARGYGVPVAEVLRANGLDDQGRGLRAGTWIRVPGGIKAPLPPGVYGVWNRWGRQGVSFVARSLGVEPSEILRLSRAVPGEGRGWMLVSPAGEHRYEPVERALMLARWRGIERGELARLNPEGGVWLLPTGRLLYLWPVEGRLTSKYGYRKLRVAGSNFHRGIDLAAPRGTPVRAPRGGYVIHAGWDTWLGWYVRLDHGDGWQTVYGHLDRLYVRKGQRVFAGDALGAVGATGKGAFGVHLHFEVRRRGKSVDPLLHLPARSAFGKSR